MNYKNGYFIVFIAILFIPTILTAFSNKKMTLKLFTLYLWKFFYEKNTIISTIYYFNFF